MRTLTQPQREKLLKDIGNAREMYERWDALLSEVRACVQLAKKETGECSLPDGYDEWANKYQKALKSSLDEKEAEAWRDHLAGIERKKETAKSAKGT